MIILRVEVVDLFYPPSCDRPQPIPVFPISWIIYIRAVHCSSTGLFSDRSFKRKSKIKKKIRKKGSSVFAFSVCVFVCLRRVGHSFWPRGLIFGMKDPWVNPQKYFFCFLKFWDLTYLWLFLDFSEVFCYISSINFKIICRSNQMT